MANKVFKFSKIITQVNVKLMSDASNFQEWEGITPNKFDFLYQVSAHMINYIFQDKLFFSDTGELRTDISNKDMATLKLIFELLILQATNHFTPFDFFNYDITDGVDGANTSIKKYQPETLMEMVLQPIPMWIESMSMYQAIVNDNEALLLYDDPTMFLTIEEWGKWLEKTYAPLALQVAQNKKDIAEITAGGVSQSDFDAHVKQANDTYNALVKDMNEKFSKVYTKTEIDSKLEEKADKSDTYTKDEIDNGVGTGLDKKLNINGEGNTYKSSIDYANNGALAVFTKKTSNGEEGKFSWDHDGINLFNTKVKHVKKAENDDEGTNLGQVKAGDKILSDRIDSNDRTDEIHDAEIKALFATNVSKSDGIVISFHPEPQKITNTATMTTTMWWTKDPSVLYQSTSSKHIIMAGNQGATILIKGSYTTEETAEDIFSISALIDGKYTQPALINDKGEIKDFIFEATTLKDNIQHLIQFHMKSATGSYTISNLTLEVALIQQGSGSGGEIDWSDVIKTGDQINKDLIDELDKGKINALDEANNLSRAYFYHNVGSKDIVVKSLYNDTLKTKTKDGVKAINELVDRLEELESGITGITGSLMGVLGEDSETAIFTNDTGNVIKLKLQGHRIKMNITRKGTRLFLEGILQCSKGEIKVIESSSSSSICMALNPSEELGIRYLSFILREYEEEQRIILNQGEKLILSTSYAANNVNWDRGEGVDIHEWIVEYEII